MVMFESRRLAGSMGPLRTVRPVCRQGTAIIGLIPSPSPGGSEGGAVVTHQGAAPMEDSRGLGR